MSCNNSEAPSATFGCSRTSPEVATDTPSGTIRVTLGKESVQLDLKESHRAEGAVFDRFGVFTSTVGGQMVKVYFDDLTYSVGKQ